MDPDASALWQRITALERGMPDARGLETRTRYVEQKIQELWQELGGAATICGEIDVTVTLGGVARPGALVSVAGPSGFAASGTTDGSGLYVTPIPVAGSYTITATYGCASASHTITATCSVNTDTEALAASTATIAWTVTRAGVAAPGIVVTTTGPSGFSATATTNGSGVATVAIPAPGSYTGSVAAGCLGGSTTISATCTANTATIAATGGTTALAFHVQGCSGLPAFGVPGSVVTLTGPGGFTASGTTNSTGDVTFDVSQPGTGSYSWSASSPSARLVGTSGTATVATCNTSTPVIVQLINAAGYHCLWCQPEGPYPAPDTLTLTNAQGVITLTFSGSEWLGTQSIAATTCAAGCSGTNCAGPPAAGTLEIDWSLSANGVLVGQYYSCHSGITGTEIGVDATAPTAGCRLTNVNGTITACTNPPGFAMTVNLSADPLHLFTGTTATVLE